MKYTTLNKIRACSPCASGWTKLLKHLGKTEADDEPLAFAVILQSNGLYDAAWCCRAAPEYDREWRLFAVWCVTQVKHLMTDPRSINALRVAEDYANGLATPDELAAASDAARAAWAASDAAWAAWAAWAASDAAWAARAAWAASDAAARDAARAAQVECFMWVVNGGLTEFEEGLLCRTTK